VSLFQKGESLSFVAICKNHEGASPGTRVLRHEYGRGFRVSAGMVECPYCRIRELEDEIERLNWLLDGKPED